MTTTITRIRPEAIEARSFAIIEEEFERQTGRSPREFAPDQFAIIRRVIHATGDFSFAHSLRFHPEAIAIAIAMLRAGRALVTDVRMTLAGISKNGLAPWGCRVLCELGRPELARAAAARGLTRTETAILSALGHDPGLVVIGNAPTALLTVIKHCREEREISLSSAGGAGSPFTGVIIGVPVGFVNAAESKDILASQMIPHITNLGRKGGSPVGAAIVNALIRLAAEGSATP